MAGDSSFDVVSKVDPQEVDNALNQAKKEIEQRYDFKGVGASIDCRYFILYTHYNILGTIFNRQNKQILGTLYVQFVYCTQYSFSIRIIWN